MKTTLKITGATLGAIIVAATAGLLVSDTRIPLTSSLASLFDDDVRVTFVGDIMLDRYLRRMHHPDGYHSIASAFTPLFYDSDIVVGNLEGPITDHQSVSRNTSVGDINNTRFTFAPESVSFLTNHSFDVVSIGNNHIRDFGVDGVLQTKQYLDANDIAYVGDPFNPAKPHRVTKNGITITFLSYNQFGSQSVASTSEAIAQHNTNSDWIVVYAHWGGEYQNTPTQQQRGIASTFANAGADIIIGSHPHVWQPHETIQDTHVYYSLGNFVFDQFFSANVRCGGVVSLTLSEESIVERNGAEAHITKKGTVERRRCGIDA